MRSIKLTAAAPGTLLMVAGVLLAGVLVAFASAAAAATLLPPAEIQSTFFNGTPFTASTPSNIRFTMIFTADGKVTREPVGKSGIKGAGTWKLSKDGFCTAWKGSKAACFTLVVAGANKWNVMRGPAVMASWSK